MLYAMLGLLKKEFLALFRDKKSRFVLIGPPLIQLLVFGYAASYDLNRVPIAIYNEDSGSASRELIARFTGARAFREAGRITRQSGIAEFINPKKALLVLHVEREFTRDLSKRKPASIQLIIDGRNSNTALIALNYAQTILADFNRSWTAQQRLEKPSARLEIRAWFNPNLNSQWFIVPGIIGLLTLVVTMLVTALEVLIGKALPGVLIGLVEASFIVLMAVYWFQVPFVGDVAALYLGIILFVVSTVGVGLMISSLAATQQQGLLGAFLFIVPSIILSGFATPIANMPEAMQTLTLLIPLRYFLVIVRGVMLEGIPLPLLADQYWPMAVIGLVNLGLAAWMFRRRLY
ncbi:Antibiotic ABC transporter permease [Candidatus Methylobacter favarea]|uniref:Transport permease protein n=1 Tax=Candidatus Methylobacter favarea TaxID=2707345 RepID=A0A8S0WSL3_9GAMM|nr:ABC transporter permease [Candidatus Methylobacter favarea]CAA9892881.1 Antibiotic ABC transporter permease [Candidatus Methylobacter favarea]